LIVEFAGADNPGHGHNRHGSDNTVILWRYERSGEGVGVFLKLGQVVAPGAMWALLLEPLVRQAMWDDAGGNPPAPDVDLIRGRITAMLGAELDLVSDAQRASILTLVHDELAGRIAQWSGPGIKERFGMSFSPRVI